MLIELLKREDDLNNHTVRVQDPFTNTLKFPSSPFALLKRYI